MECGIFLPQPLQEKQKTNKQLYKYITADYVQN